LIKEEYDAARNIQILVAGSTITTVYKSEAGNIEKVF